MLFNINDYVKVKLTPKGIEILARKHEELKKSFRAYTSSKYR